MTNKKILLAAMPAKKPVYRIRQLQAMLYVSLLVNAIAAIAIVAVIAHA